MVNKNNSVESNKSPNQSPKLSPKLSPKMSVHEVKSCVNKIMCVIKRDGSQEEISFDKIMRRIKNLSYNLEVNLTKVSQKVIENIFDGVTTAELDELSAQIAFSMSTEHPDYGLLAGRLTVSNHQKNTPKSFYRAMKILYDNVDVHGKHTPIISKDTFDVIRKYKKEIEDVIDYSRDFYYDYFGFKTLQRSYLMKVHGEYIERIQHMWMRVSIGIHKDDNNLKTAIETYNMMSQKQFIHATPTLYNSGTPRPQLSSCFLISMNDDSIDGIFTTLKQCALISKWAGGIGLHIHNVRSKGTPIRGTNGTSNGIVPMLKVFNHTARYVDQCLHPNTIVYTKEGPKCIKNIIIGDKVISDDGNMYRITKVLDSQYRGNLYELNVECGLENIELTEWHPLWVIKGCYNRKTQTIINSLKNNLIKPEFIEVKNISSNDYVGFPIPKYSKDVKEFTLEDCRIYGILLACSYYENDISYCQLNQTNKQDIILFIESYFAKCGISIIYTKQMYNYVRLNWERTNRLKFSPEMFHDENNEKKINKIFLNLPKDKLVQVIRGILDTEGIITDDAILYNTKSKQIVDSLRYMCLRLGILTTGIIRKGGLSHIISIPKTYLICDEIPIEHHSSYFEYQNILYSKVKSLYFHENYQGRVIDIEVDHIAHHNFLTQSGLVMNGGGKRNGSFAIYIEPWHADILDFLELRKNHGDEEMIARDLFYALWIPDLFMKRVENDELWSLMCPDICQGLSDVYGEEFNELYTKYEKEEKYVKQIPARKIWNSILIAQIETGTPYILYKDACNIKSNQNNLGTIKSSNLCTEIVEYTSPDEIAVCNLASINLRSFVHDQTYNFDKLHEITKVITRNLNRVIDINFYPVPEAENSNKKHRPIGIGVQGLADTFCMMRYPFDSPEAKQMNIDIFETIYHAALEASSELANERESEIREYKQLTMVENRTKEIRKSINNILKKTSFTQEELIRDKYAGSYSSYLSNGGSQVSKGILQFDLWNVKPTKRWNWTELRENIDKYGVRNSLLVAPMPTASTSQILGNNECFEPFTSNMYTRRTLAGEFIVINKYLMKDLIKLGLWNEEMKYRIMAYEGSVQDIEEIPLDIKALYKTVWEIKQRTIIDMAADRGAYIDQSQSMNLFIRDPTISMLTSMHFYGWKKGLKTGQYYLRTKPVASAQKFTVDPNLLKNTTNSPPKVQPQPLPQSQSQSQSQLQSQSQSQPIKQCLRENPDCESCGS